MLLWVLLWVLLLLLLLVASLQMLLWVLLLLLLWASRLRAPRGISDPVQRCHARSTSTSYA